MKPIDRLRDEEAEVRVVTEIRTPARPEIAAAWQRASLCGLRPDAPLGHLQRVAVDGKSRLLAAAEPVLDDVARQLAGTRYCVLLAGRDARIVDRRFGQPQLVSILDSISAAPGAQFIEELTGTNSIATVLELRSGMKVVGDEHYLDAMKPYCCYGHPIFNPVTRRLEGVLDITGYAEDVNDLLAPFLVRATHDIEQRLLAGARVAEQRLLALYQKASARSTGPVVVLGEGVVLSNAPATAALAPEDYVVLNSLSHDLRRGTRTLSLTLASGIQVEVSLERVPSAAAGLVVQIRQESAVKGLRGRRQAIGTTRAAAATRSSLVAGEPGTGRTAEALRLCASGTPAAVLDAMNYTAWPAFAATVAEATGRNRPLLVENIHMLPAPDAARLRCLLKVPTGSRLVATSAPWASLSGEHAALAASFIDRVELLPLRARRGEIPALASAILRDAAAGQPRRLAPGLLEVLVNQPWPGNLHELRGVILEMVATSGSSTLRVEHLPAAYQHQGKRSRHTPLEESEYRTIVAGLETCGGNKVHAARQLGISRATLYSRLRLYGISA